MVIQKEVLVDLPSPLLREKTSISKLIKNRMTEKQKLILCCFGIFICYFYYGILQEKITRVPYGEKKEKFTYQQTLVCIQCVVNAMFAKAVMTTTSTVVDRTPTLMYIWCAISYMGAMLASNMSLRYINYPTQVLGKSCKPIPVMLLGVLIARKRYPLLKYISVLLIVIGVAVFFMKDKKTDTVDSSYGFGELLLLVSLSLDGMTGASQEKMRTEHQTQAHAMMYAVNKWSIILLGTAIVVTGEIFAFASFCSRYPYVIGNMILFSFASALGQNFIFTTVTSFGPLTCSVVTTTRKFFTILFSIIFFGNPITSRQSYAVVLVFLGLGLDAFYGKATKSS